MFNIFFFFTVSSKFNELLPIPSALAIPTPETVSKRAVVNPNPPDETSSPNADLPAFQALFKPFLVVKTFASSIPVLPAPLTSL